ncbi:superoxide dismutase [bacterium]|nr:superoxide dismutase [bacterium]
MQYEPKPLPFAAALTGISERTMAIHHDKLYVGYVNKMKEISEKLAAITNDPEKLAAANQSYSELRALKVDETFARNGVYLHEYYFNVLGGNGEANGPLLDAIVAKWGSLETFVAYTSAVGMAVRGWVVLAWDIHMGSLKVFGCDTHNQGAVWSCVPLVVLDVFEHAYFIDYGSDRKAYIADFWKNLNWSAATDVFTKVKSISLS